MLDATKSQFRDIDFQRKDTQDPSNGELCSQYQVRSIPRLVFLDGGGKVLFNNNPPMDKDSLTKLIQQYR